VKGSPWVAGDAQWRLDWRTGRDATLQVRDLVLRDHQIARAALAIDRVDEVASCLTIRCDLLFDLTAALSLRRKDRRGVGRGRQGRGRRIDRRVVSGGP